jgi:hypothetical protein
MILKKQLRTLLSRPENIAPLAMFRILFGALMLFSTLRFWLNGFIELQYIEPDFFFKYYGFHWVQAPPDWGIYVLFLLMGISACGIMLGFFYRLSASLFFLAFTYVELIDVSNYLNHYYFVSLISLLLIFLPAHRNYSLDVLFKRQHPLESVSNFNVLAIKLMLSIVYIYAGIAKLNYDWLILAQPLKTWLPAQVHLPIIGSLLTYSWVAYAFSWFGALYDLSIVFFLSWSRTRKWAFLAVIIFHLLTWWLFPIGVFPWVMIFSTLIFFPASFHKKILAFLRVPFLVSRRKVSNPYLDSKKQGLLLSFLALFFTIQLLLPWRYLAYSGNLFWHEQGYRFSWRVMLIEKAGYATFFVSDPVSGATTEVAPSDYLTVNQIKQMSTQPDLVLQFAHFLDAHFQQKGIRDPIVKAEVYVRLQNQGSKLLIDPEQDLSMLEDSFAPKNWILPDA